MWTFSFSNQVGESILFVRPKNPHSKEGVIALHHKDGYWYRISGEEFHLDYEHAKYEPTNIDKDKAADKYLISGVFRVMESENISR